MEMSRSINKDGENIMIIRFLKLFQGVNQASSKWNIKFSNALFSNGNQHNQHEDFLFMKMEKYEKKTLICLV